ncbi:MAG TPA: ABC transporter substrate-binding protein [Woeseiaceae bacterium]|nr:ABC transporter substrate-binding protein [Woeseiaceae bacterium]
MDIWLELAAFLAAGVWLGLLLWPVRPWGTRETIPADGPDADPGSIDVLVPARNEAATIERSIRSILDQGREVSVLVIDDGSEDDTARRAAALDPRRVRVLRGAPLPAGWVGKVWALHQGTACTRTPYVALVDADVLLSPGVLARMRRRLDAHRLGMISIMAQLRTAGFWERLLMPAYVYFFKLLYPFALVNSPRRRVAAAAGGCVLLRSAALAEAGGFASLRNALIDDCALAARIKHAGWPVHIALSHDVTSVRACPRLADVWRLVARSAYTELRSSPVRLLACTLAMGLLFVSPLLGAFAGEGATRWAGAVAWCGLALTQVPVLRFYRLNPARALVLPAAAMLFLAMTWHSAWQHRRGRGAAWKGRRYAGLAANAGLALLFAGQPCSVAQGAPPDTNAAVQVVDDLHEALMDAVNRGDEMSFESRYRLLEPAVTESHDFSTVARLVGGAFWGRMTQDERARFEDAFRQASIATYAKRFTGDGQPHFEKATLLDESAGRVTAESRLIRPNGEPVTFEYILQPDDDRWRIVSILVDGVSDLALQRARLTKLYEEEGFEKVLEHLREKAKAD